EHLPDWPVHGTTGYDFSRLVDGLFVDQRAAARMERVYSSFVGHPVDFERLLYSSKRLIMRVALASELNVLASMLGRISDSDRHTRDFTLNSLREAIREVVACFPVYRTYITADGLSEDDVTHIYWAVKLARKRTRTADVSVFDFFRAVLLLENSGERSEEFIRDARNFAMKLQQFTSPVTAKGLEDTAFYIYNRLISLNEVGSDPSRFGVSVQAFHHANMERVKRWPHSMLATSTHDSKRAADVRMRINVLSEIPGEWKARIGRWSKLNEKNKRKVDGKLAPGRNDEYMLYQTLVGSWPLGEMDDKAMARFSERMVAYMVKAAREAKVHMSWINPNQQYEDALVEFVKATLNRGRKIFVEDMTAFLKKVSRLGLYNSLSQTLLKLMSPGVPDIYQGDEIWNLSLVDPDNRRPVDYGLRREMLDGIKSRAAAGTGGPIPFVREMLENIGDGRAKLYLIWRILSLRKRHERLFRDGDYNKLAAEGNRGSHLCVFSRTHQGISIIAVAPRLLAKLLKEPDDLPVGPDVWQGTLIELPPDGPDGTGEYVNALTGEKVSSVDIDGKLWLRAEEVLAEFPVAVVMPQAALGAE
ncbi:MAG: malto-oligosyltrehalose synthase, partial [Nitrospirota bacterium]